MVDISLEKVKELREKTGIGIMACRGALEETGGDFAQAEKILGGKAQVKAESGGRRGTVEGLVASYIHAGGRVGAMVEINSETDFVSRSSEFKDLARELAMQVCAMDPESVEELFAQEWIRDPSKKVGDLLSELQGKTKENIVIKRFCRFEVGS